jgi:predicted RNA-binding Zn-ribbon protein involved in translation (DUF1610 family)
MDERFGFVYVWRDRLRKRFYVGSHWGHPDDGYICSSPWMKRAYRNRPGDFRRRVVATVKTSRTDLLQEEQRWLDMIEPSALKIRYYNVSRSIKNPWHQHEASRWSVAQKIGFKLKGRPLAHGFSAEVRRAISVGRKAAYERRRERGEPAFSMEARLKVSRTKLAIGRKQPEAYKAHMREVMRLRGAENPDWDRVHKLECQGCGKEIVGRKAQKYCTTKCGKAYLYRLSVGQAARVEK